MLPEPASLPLLPDARRHSVVVASTPPQPFHSPIQRPPPPFWNSPSISSRTRLHLSRLRASPAFNLFSRWSDRTLTILQHYEVGFLGRLQGSILVFYTEQLRSVFRGHADRLEGRQPRLHHQRKLNVFRKPLHADRSRAGIGSERHENARVVNFLQVSHRNGKRGSLLSGDFTRT